MEQPFNKRIDESWKEQAEREKQKIAQEVSAARPKPTAKRGVAPAGEVSFDHFISSLTMEALVALGEMPHPATGQSMVSLAQAKYIIDVLGVLDEKTAGNLTVEEQQLLQDALYQLRMRFLSKSNAAGAKEGG
jgi:hypothetical protein